MSDIAEASQKEWFNLAEELATYFNEINEENARELLWSSRFGDPEDQAMVEALVEQAEKVD